MNRDAVYEALCRTVGAGEIAYAKDVGDALRGAGDTDVDDVAVAEILESLVDAGAATVVPVDQPEGHQSRLAYGIPPNSL